jgi:predicted nucleotidyltransferase
MTFEQAKRVLAALQRYQVEYVLIGSMAMAIHSVIRATRDMDFFIRPDADNVERLKRALRSVYDDDSIDEISADDLLGDYPAVQYGPPEDDASLDILTRLGEAFAYEDLEAEEVEVDGIVVRVATARMLIKMKANTVRPRDQADVLALRSHLGIEDDAS